MNDPGYGALVLSLDFELHWGVFDIYDTESAYTSNLRGVWSVVPRLLDLFREFDAAATWATVGSLFATSREHLERARPAIRPRYADERLDPYTVPVGESEADDPFHYAPTLIRQVMETPRQEIGTHTFSHIYWDAPGPSVEAARADLQSAQAIAREYGLELRSVVLPRNQVNDAFLPILKEAGIASYRGREPHWMYRGVDPADFDRPHKRAARLVDRYLPISGYNLGRWDRVVRRDGLCNVPSTRFLQPKTQGADFEAKRMAWTQRAIAAAAEKHGIVHLWWHPHDFGAAPDENLAMLREILETAARYRQSHGLKSLTMDDVAQTARRL
jgi:peptidoglycan/xylan/chitin deacetylase (PgdA/CDA1 family)